MPRPMAISFGLLLALDAKLGPAPARPLLGRPVYFFSTDPNTTARQVPDAQAERRPIDPTFHETKESLGARRAQPRKPKAVADLPRQEVDRDRPRCPHPAA